jgi:hypothetical protein
MRFENHSRFLMPKELWHELADALALADALPRALVDGLGLYSGKTLTIVVRPERAVAAAGDESGSYTYGRIRLRPCRRCTAGFLTEVYIHELIHAWCDQYRANLYFNVGIEVLAEVFAETGYECLGGRRGVTCSTYRLDAGPALRRLSAFRLLARRLHGCPIMTLKNCSSRQDALRILK